VFRNLATIEYRDASLDNVLRVGTASEVRWAELESDARQQRLAAERALDSVLADSFPASDPPSWTLGITRPQPERQATNDEAVAPDDSRVALVSEDVIDVSRPATNGGTFGKGLVSLAAAAGIALLVPLIILLIGTPIALAVQGVVAATSWVLALIFG
jgi:hypothetical protein